MPNDKSCRIEFTAEELKALLAVCDGYVADPCIAHGDDEHGNEDECIGWGPKATAALDAAY